MALFGAACNFAQHLTQVASMKYVKRHLRQTENRPGRVAKPETFITQIAISHCSSGAFEQTFLPMLAHLTRNCKDRWVTWITDKPLCKNALIKANVDLDKLLVVQPKGKQDYLWICWEAMHNGLSDSVVCELNNISKSEISHLDGACKIGACRGVLLSNTDRRFAY